MNPTDVDMSWPMSFSFIVPWFHLQAGPAGLPAAYCLILPPAQHLQQSQGWGAEPWWRARCLWGKFYIISTFGNILFCSESSEQDLDVSKIKRAFGVVLHETWCKLKAVRKWVNMESDAGSAVLFWSLKNANVPFLRECSCNIKFSTGYLEKQRIHLLPKH